MAKHDGDGTSSDEPRKKRKAKGAGRGASQASSKAGAAGSLIAAIGAVLVLGVLLYASFRGTDTRAEAAPEQAQAPKAEAQAAPGAESIPARVAPKAPAGEGWNDAQIAWVSYEEGLAKAKSANKPVCLVFYTSWCPHCKNYSRIFSDPRVVTRAKDFVMVRVNPDDEEAIGARYAPDGAYVPRTFFLAPGGELYSDVHAQRPQFLHFYDENDPASLLAGMDAALRKVARPM